MTRPTVTTELLNESACPVLQGLWMKTAERYNRGTYFAEFPVNKPFTVPMWLMSFIGGGASLSIVGEWSLEVADKDGAVVAACKASGNGGTVLTFSVPAINRRGSHRFVAIKPSGERSPTYWGHLGSETVDDFVPVWTHSFDSLNDMGVTTVGADGKSTTRGAYRWMLLPLTDADRKALPPLDLHPATHFTGDFGPADLFTEDIVPDLGEYDVFRTATGALTTAHAMSYPFSHMASKYPVCPQIDGERGVGCINMVAGVHIGRATRTADPASGRMGINYLWNLHRFAREHNGRLTTLIGWMSDPDAPPIYHGDSNNPKYWKFRGDRSRIPTDRNHRARTWQGFFRSTSVIPGKIGDPTPEGDGRQQHPGNPVWYEGVGWTKDLAPGIPDITQTSIWAWETSGKDHTQEWIATEFATGLHDVFGVAEWTAGGELIAAERGKHRIVAFDFETRKMRVVLQGEALASVNAQTHQTSSSFSLARIQAAPCVQPECIRVRGDWCYYGGKQMRSIRRVHLKTGEWQVVVPLLDTPTEFLVFALSDGSFGDDAMPIWCGFEANMRAYPKAQLRNAATGLYDRRVLLANGDSPGVVRGRGPAVANREYAGGLDVYDGELVFGASRFGVNRLTRALPSDRKLTNAEMALLAQGRREALHSMCFSACGYPLWGHALPWGESAAMDFLLEFYKHPRPVVVEPPPPPPPPAPEPPAPPPPPPPAPQTGFAAVELLRTDTVGPTAALNQGVILNLHGSGGGAASMSQGTYYRATLGADLTFRESATLEWVLVRANDGAGGAAIRVVPHDTHGNFPNGQLRESYHLGWQAGAAGAKKLYPVVQQRYLALIDFVKKNVPQASATKWVVSGPSMGAWGALRLGLRFADRFAAVYADRPIWRYSRDTNGGEVRLIDYDSNVVFQTVPNIPHQADGAPGAEVYDMLRIVADPTKRVPWIGWYCGRLDGYSPFSDHIAAVDALRAAGRGFAFSWNNGDHANGNAFSLVSASYPTALFELGKGYPVFSQHSRDQDPRIDLVGGINIGLTFRNVVETVEGWSCEVANLDGACTVTVAPHSDVFLSTVQAKAISIPAAKAWVPVSFVATGAPPVEPPAPEPEPEFAIVEVPEGGLPAGRYRLTRI